MSLPHAHVITPGDHFSPRTGSAIPTVVHGLATAGLAAGARTHVVVARGTYPDRYDSATVLEYDERPSRRGDRYLDAASSRLGLGRPRARRRYAATVAAQASWEPSVVLAHNAPQLVAEVDAARHTPVLYAHNELLRTYSAREAGAALGAAHRVVCVSDYLAARTSDRLPRALRDRVVVVRNGVDTAFFHPPEVPDDGDHEDGSTLHVVFVGRMIPAKGADVLVEAARRLDRDDVRLTVVGAVGFDPASELTGFERDVHRAASPLGHRVRLVPFRPREEVARILRTADVAAVPSRWPDPCPLTVLEAMASGAAVVASAVGGIPETAGAAAALVPPDDPAALADVLAGWADDRGSLSRARAAGLAHARARDWRQVLPELTAALGGASVGDG